MAPCLEACRGGVVRYWSVQRVWGGFGFFFSMVRPTRLEGFRSFFNGLPNGPGGIRF